MMSSIQLFIVILFILLLSFPAFVMLISPAWWSSVASLSAHIPVNSRSVCHQLSGLSLGQERICELFGDHMPSIGAGAKHAIEECQWHFRQRRWNCSAPSAGIFSNGPVHSSGTREAAYTYSIVSAGITHAVSRHCRLGVLRTCGCGRDKRPQGLRKEWTWGGCGDNIDYGYAFAQDFIDIRERERDHAKKSNEYGRSLMNRWNNEVGRRLTKRGASINCKCHGVSGSCNLKTCWRQLADLHDIGSQLLEKYEDAVRVKINKRGNLQMIKRNRRKRASRMDLVYIDDSPNYCQKDPRNAISGTHGRICAKNGKGIDRCEALCCGRGYNTFKKTVVEKCNCAFQWCCKVVCKQCHKTFTMHTCK